MRMSRIGVLGVVLMVVLWSAAASASLVSVLPEGFLQSLASTERYLTNRPSFPSAFGSAPAEGEINMWIDSEVTRTSPLSLAIQAASDRWRPSWHVNLYHSATADQPSPLHMPLLPGDQLYVSLYYKVSDDWTPREIGQSGMVEVRVEVTYLENGTRTLALITSLEPVGEPEDGWQRVEGTVTLPDLPEGVEYDRIRFDFMSTYAKGTVWFTDIEIAKGRADS